MARRLMSGRRLQVATLSCCPVAATRCCPTRCCPTRCGCACGYSLLRSAIVGTRLFICLHVSAIVVIKYYENCIVAHKCQAQHLQSFHFVFFFNFLVLFLSENQIKVLYMQLPCVLYWLLLFVFSFRCGFLQFCQVVFFLLPRNYLCSSAIGLLLSLRAV